MTAVLHDPALPQLAQALDGAAMARAFGALLSPRGLAVRACHIDRVKLRPGRNASVAYLLQLQPAAGGPAFTQRVATRVCSGGSAARRHASAVAVGAPLLPSAAGPALSHLPALDMVAWWWPNDARLTAPALLDDAHRLPSLLQPVVDVLSHGRGRLCGQAVHIAQHVPEHRLCVRVDLQWVADGRVATQTVYAKTSRAPDTATAHARLRSLQASDAWQQGRLTTPAALLHQPDADLHWQAALPGSTLLDQPGAISRLGATLGAQLAALHATPVAGLPATTAEGLRTTLNDVVQVLAPALPGQATRLHRLQRLLLAGLPHLADGPTATLHGDLHARNVLVDGDCLGLIDLDGLQQGPALLELGAWVADAQCRALLAGQPAAAARAQWQPLLDGHARASGQAPAPAALAWATGWQLLVQRVWRAVVNAKPGRLAAVPALLDQALALAGSPQQALA